MIQLFDIMTNFRVIIRIELTSFHCTVVPPYSNIAGSKAPIIVNCFARYWPSHMGTALLHEQTISFKVQGAVLLHAVSYIIDVALKI